MGSCTVGLCVWIPSFSTVCEIELYYYSFILFAFQYSVVETYHLRSFTAHMPSDICFAILHYECSGTCPLVAVCVYDGYIQAFLLALGPKVYTLNFKCQLSKMIINWQHHQQCRLPVAYFLAKTWFFVLFILTISVSVVEPHGILRISISQIANKN